VPSKTFHFGPDFEQVVLDLFESHLRLTWLLEAYKSILPEAGEELADVPLAIARGDRAWARAWRQLGMSPPNSN
jgi:hypothetical protein